MAVACLESAYAIRYGKLYRLSEQKIVDCSPYDYGCNGGWPTNSYYYFFTNGVVKSINYPNKGIEQVFTAGFSLVP